MLFHYQDAFYREYGAVTRKQCGKGSIYYLGCGLEEELLRQVMAKIWEEQGICCEESPEGVEIVYRGSKDHRIRITLNHNAREVEMDGVVLAPFECRIEEEQEDSPKGGSPIAGSGCR